MLVVYDDRGMIVHIILQAQASIEDMLERYEQLGQNALVYDGDALDIMTNYVVDGEAVPKPKLTIAGKMRAVIADGRDTLSLKFDPPRAHLDVLLDDVVVAEAEIDDGRIELFTGYAGRYRVRLTPEFPWLGDEFEFEAR
jgi:hypothetical protein